MTSTGTFLPRALPRSRVLRLAATSAAALLAVALGTGPSVAQTSLDKLKQMKVASTDLNIPLVPQTGRNADAIRANLKDIKLPPGFKIDLYAIVPDARHMAVARSTNMLFVGTRKTTVWAVTNRNGGDAATEVKSFAPSLKFSIPNGVCFTNNGILIVVEHNRVLNFPAAEFFYEGPDVAVGEIVPQGQLVPPDEESFNHGARTCRVAIDNKLYITLGQPFNVPPRDKVDLYRSLGIGGIIRNEPGRHEPRGLRHRHPQLGRAGFRPARRRTLWFTDNQTDGMGDNQPPGELNHASKAGMDFGYPYWNGHVKVAGSSAAPDLKSLPEPKNAVFPQVEFPAHLAQLGMTFYTGKMFLERYRNGIFVAAHGSWNSTVPTGALVNFVPVDKGHAGKSEVFADGFRDDNGVYRGRPVDVAVLRDGSLLISDDFAGALYRVTYAAPQGAADRRAVDVAAIAAALAMLATLTASPAAQAAVANDAGADAGRRLASTYCASCHGLDGLSAQPDAPNLAGQPPPLPGHAVAGLPQRRAPARDHEGVIARPLTDEQIALLAAWFASIRVDATPPPGGPPRRRRSAVSASRASAPISPTRAAPPPTPRAAVPCP